HVQSLPPDKPGIGVHVGGDTAPFAERPAVEEMEVLGAGHQRLTVRREGKSVTALAEAGGRSEHLPGGGIPYADGSPLNGLPLTRNDRASVWREGQSGDRVRRPGP